ncbi:MAG: hypothetical protein ACRC78_03015 [Planktothrix sp.]
MSDKRLEQIIGFLEGFSPSSTGTLCQELASINQKLGDTSTPGTMLYLLEQIRLCTCSGLPSSGIFTQTFLDSDLTFGALAVTHNLGQRPASVLIWSNLGQLLSEPDAAEYINPNQILVRLNSFTPLPGTWSIVTGLLGYELLFDQSNLAGNILTIPHGLNKLPPAVSIWDTGTDLYSNPTQITAIDANTLEIDFAGIAPIGGTWVISVGNASNIYEQSFTPADLSTGVLTAMHNLGRLPAAIVAWDNANVYHEDFDSISTIDSNTVSIDMTSLGIIGTWKLVIA